MQPRPEPSAAATQGSPPSTAATPTQTLAPPAVVSGHAPLSDLIALEPAASGVWYLRGGEGRAWVGHAEAAGSDKEVEAGPAPVALAATPEAVFVLEGRPTEEGSKSRTDSVERLDPESLAVVDSAPVDGLPTDVAVEDGAVWIVTTDGVVYAFDEQTLDMVGQVSVGGRGAARLSTGAGTVWILNGRVGDDGSSELLLHRLETTQTTSPTTVSLADAGTSGVLDVGSSVWVGAGGPTTGPGEGVIYSIGLDLSRQATVAVARPVALTEADGWLWWASATGELGGLNTLSGVSRSTLRLQATTTDLISSGGLLWAASTDLVTVSPEATP